MSTIRGYADARDYITNHSLKELSVKVHEDPQLIYRIMTLFADQILFPAPERLILKTLTVWLFRKEKSLEHPKFGHLAGYIIKGDSIDINETTHEGGTYLHFAAAVGKVDLMAELLLRGANVEARDVLGHTPLHFAAHNGRKECVPLLLEKGASIDAMSLTNSTPLHCAIVAGKTDVLRKLIQEGANVDEKNHKDNTPLHYAAYEGQLACLKELLLTKKVNVKEKNSFGRTPLDLAVAQNKYECIDELLREMVSDEERRYGNSSLHLAVFIGHEKGVQALIKRGDNIEAKNLGGNTPLHIAAYYNHTGCLRILLDSGAKMDANNANRQTPLDLAHNPVNIDSLIILLTRSVTGKDKFNNTVLHYAAQRSNVTLRKNLEREANVNRVNLTGDTPLHLVAFNDDEDQQVLNMESLLDYGADIHARTKEGKTPLHLALKKGRTKLACAMIKRGASLYVFDNKNKSPLSLCEPEVRSAVLSTLSPLDVELTALIPLLEENKVSAIEILFESWSQELVLKAFTTGYLSDYLIIAGIDKLDNYRVYDNGKIPYLMVPQDYIAHYRSLSKEDQHIIDFRNQFAAAKIWNLLREHFRVLIPTLEPQDWLMRYREVLRTNTEMRKEMLAFSLPAQFEALEPNDLLAEEYLTLEAKLKELQSNLKTEHTVQSFDALCDQMGLLGLTFARDKQIRMDIHTNLALKNPRLKEQREAYAKREEVCKKKERINEIEELFREVSNEFDTLNKIEIPREFLDPVYKTLLHPDDCWLDPTTGNKQICSKESFLNGCSPFTGQPVNLDKLEPAPEEFREKLRKFHTADQDGVKELTKVLKNLTIHGE